MAGYVFSKTYHDNTQLSTSFNVDVFTTGFTSLVYMIVPSYNLGSPTPRIFVYISDGVTQIALYSSPVILDGNSLAIWLDNSAQRYLISLTGLSAGNDCIIYDRLDAIG